MGRQRTPLSQVHASFLPLGSSGDNWSMNPFAPELYGKNDSSRTYQLKQVPLTIYLRVRIEAMWVR